MYLIQVIVEHSVHKLDRPFTYLSKKPIFSGVRVAVSFRNKNVIGYVIDSLYTNKSKKELEEESGFKYSFIQDVIDEKPLLNNELVDLAYRLQNFYLAPLISIFQTMLPKGLKPKTTLAVKEKTQIALKVIKQGTPKTKTQQELYKFIKAHDEPLLTEIPYSNAPINALMRDGFIEKFEKRIERNPYQIKDFNKQEIALTEDQKNVVKGIMSDKRHVCLLHGVTGSGKTEVYLALAQNTIDKGQNVIMLVPEISLTPMIIEQFKQRFQEDVAIFHSRLSEGERYDEYCKIRDGKVKIVVGARSAVFAPLNNIGLIIIDEEHDTSYKQSSMFMYETKHVALMRLKQGKIVLGSATPSLESYAKALKGTYGLYKLDKRINKMPLPNVEIIDLMKAEMSSLGFFSKRMLQKIEETLHKGEQVLLLLNRRGYSNLMICEDCHMVRRCPICDVTLTYHQSDQKLKCHYCGYQENYENICPHCKKHHMKKIGFGTQKVEEALVKHFPEYKVLRYDFDTTRHKNGHQELLEQFQRKKAQILLGTQMISKGLDFPDVTFVGVILADQSLMSPDFRAAEHTFDLLCQVAGRSGRSSKQGCVMIQTYNKDHFVFKYVKTQDYVSFFKQEMKFRQMLDYPPFCFLVALHIQSKNEEVLKQVALKLSNYLKKYPELKVLGPVKWNVYRLKDTYRYRIIVKYRETRKILEILNKILYYYDTKETRVQVVCDFYPQTLD